jgi:hypothetical protein
MNESDRQCLINAPIGELNLTMQIHVNNGAATLTGNVHSRAERLLAEKITLSVEGIRTVVSNLAALDDTQS